MDAFVNTTIENAVATITFFHPSQNALPRYLLNEIIAALKSMDTNPNVKIILLRSGGERTFCAGANFDELLAITDLDSAKLFFLGFAELMIAMMQTRQPIVVAVQGKAVGGGVGICAAADYCIATENAAIKLSELAIGIGPFVIGPVVQRKTGAASFAHLAYLPTIWHTSDWTKMNGIFNTVVKDFSELETAAKLWAETTAQYSAEALQEIKKMNWRNSTDIKSLEKQILENANISAKLVLSETTKKALKAFKNK